MTYGTISFDAINQDVVDAIGQMSMLGGMPATTKARELAQQVRAENEGSDT